MYFPCVCSRFKEDELKYKLTKTIKDNNIQEMLNELIEWNKQYCYESDDEINNDYLKLKQAIQNFLNIK